MSSYTILRRIVSTAKAAKVNSPYKYVESPISCFNRS